MKVSLFSFLTILLTIATVTSCSDLVDEAITDKHLEKGKFDSSKWDQSAYE